jgi:hypothetical protein
MMTVTVSFINRQNQREQREQEIADLSKASVDAIVDTFEGQIGTVASVDHNGRNLYRQHMR